jgi:hypothetical protein
MRPKLLLTLLAAALLGVFVPGAVGSSSSASQHVALQCDENGMLCTEPLDPYSYDGTYIGHDEPSLLFYSNTPGSGYNQVYHLKIPADSTTPPAQDGSGGTWNFQLHPTFWFGMALCDNQSAPNPGGSKLAGPNVPCQPDSDSNIFTGLTPTASGGTNYFGQHPGTAFMELQLYPPGWAGANTITDSCSGSQWCAAMTIDSDALNQNTNQFINSTCANQLFGGTEYVNFAYLTHSGTPLGPPNPLQVNGASFNIGSSDLLRMNPGDQLTVSLHDTANGLQTVIQDGTNGQTGTMTASAGNGFGAIRYAPEGKSCKLLPFDFHPMYSTSSENTRVLWAAHGYNIAFSDEIGHWEYCNAVDFSAFPFPCTSAGIGDPSLDADDIVCAPASVSFLVPVSGCTNSDEDFDGLSYQNVWPGISGTTSSDTSAPVVFSSPTFNDQQFNRVAFETDLPRIEATGLSPNNNCQRFSPTGTGCVNPPNGAAFYPLYSAVRVGGACRWELGGPNFPATINNFGGTSTAEFGPLVRFDYPAPTGDASRFNDFRNVLSSNPCPS